MMSKRTVSIKRATFPSSFKEAQWILRVNETVSDYVIWINIQRRIKSKIWSAQLSYLNSLTC